MIDNFYKCYPIVKWMIYSNASLNFLLKIYKSKCILNVAIDVDYVFVVIKFMTQKME